MKIKTTLLIFLCGTAISQNIDCVGNSITRNGYPQYAGILLNADGINFVVSNYGITGSGVIVNKYKDEPEFAEILCRKAQYVTVLMGANDWFWYSTASLSDKDLWESEYKYLVNKFKKNSTVLLGLLIHRASVNGNDVTLANATMDEMNVIINKIANQYGLQTIDFTSAIGTDPANFWTSDGLHPNSIGTKLLGHALYDVAKYLPVGNKGINSCNPVIPPVVIPPVVIQTLSFSLEQIKDEVWFSWSSANDATSYKLKKAFKIGDQWNYKYHEFINGENSYLDSDFILGQKYYCSVKAYKHSTVIGESPVHSVVYTQYLGIDDDEYWEVVEDYEKQKKIGWFGCNADF
ncbi:GDSL-type esterase/lipase family protein [Candidatus Neomarinimicrobiota bacterium]